uniref:RNA-directed RNA polymerase n=1 Tax=Neuropteran tombus-related virus TaxID=2822557 RepID=A0A8A6RP62_9TOMB|nr:RNA-dependent RNA polymerase [Neuropteran tombus-related virus]
MEPKSKRQFYLRHLQSLEDGKPPRHSITPFSKIEKMSTSRYKPPRLIQARHATHNIIMGSYIKPLEYSLFKNNKNKHHFGKGNFDQVAQKIQKFLSKYDHYTELDFDSFDAHVTPEHLKVTHTYYNSCFKHDPELGHILKKTIKNVCVTRQGDKWKILGTRMSGDVDTSLGNSLIVYALLKQLLEELEMEGDAIVNGDDSIIFTNKPIDIKKAVEILKKYNMTAKMKESVKNIHTVDFCQSRFVYKSNGKPTMMMDPERVYSKFGMTHRVVTRDSYLHFLYELTECLGLTHCNTPIGYSWLDNLPAMTSLQRKEYKEFKYLDKEVFYAMEQQRRCEVSDRTYTQSMFEAYPNVLEVAEKLRKLPRTISKFLMTPLNYTIHINHDSKTLALNIIVTKIVDATGQRIKKMRSKHKTNITDLTNPQITTLIRKFNDDIKIFEQRRSRIQDSPQHRTTKFISDSQSTSWADDDPDGLWLSDSYKQFV